MDIQAQRSEAAFSVLNRPDTVARLFLGFSVPASIRAKLQAGARTHFGNYFNEFVPEENWHITLFFFGEVHNHSQYLPRLKQPLPQTFVPTISFTHLGRGGQRDQLWAYVALTPALRALREALDERLRKIHFPRPVGVRKFAPHIHLANFYPTVSGLGVADAPALAAYATQEVHLYKSTLTPKGSVYDIETTVPLGSS